MKKVIFSSCLCLLMTICCAQYRYAISPKYSSDSLNKSKTLFNTAFDLWNSYTYVDYLDSITYLLEESLNLDSTNYRSLILHSSVINKPLKLFDEQISKLEDSLVKSWGYDCYAGIMLNTLNDVKAVELLNKSLSFYPKNSDARSTKSELLYELGEYDLAIYEKKELIRLFPNHVPYKSRLIEIVVVSKKDFKLAANLTCLYVKEHNLSYDELLFRLSSKNRKRVLKQISLN